MGNEPIFVATITKLIPKPIKYLIANLWQIILK